MNRFEALHALGLEEGASDDDIKLALYGIEKAVAKFDFSDIDALQMHVDAFLERARKAKKYLLNPVNKSAARKVQAYYAPDQKVTISSLEERRARKAGLEKLRIEVCRYLGATQDRRRNSIILLVVCVVVGFMFLRYVRIMVARLTLFGVLAVVAICGSTILTKAMLDCRKTKAHIVEIDEALDVLEEAEKPGAAERADASCDKSTCEM